MKSDDLEGRLVRMNQRERGSKQNKFPREVCYARNFDHNPTDFLSPPQSQIKLISDSLPPSISDVKKSKGSRHLRGASTIGNIFTQANAISFPKPLSPMITINNAHQSQLPNQVNSLSETSDKSPKSKLKESYRLTCASPLPKFKVGISGFFEKETRVTQVKDIFLGALFNSDDNSVDGEFDGRSCASPSKSIGVNNFFRTQTKLTLDLSQQTQTNSDSKLNDNQDNGCSCVIA